MVTRPITPAAATGPWPRPARPGPGPARGFSLLEVLVTVVLVSFGLLGLMALQARAVQTSVGAEDSNRAALLANEMASTMWGQATVNLPSATVNAWDTRVGDPAAGGLPNGNGTVVITGNVARITVTWRPPHEPNTREYRYVTEVLVP